MMPPLTAGDDAVLLRQYAARGDAAAFAELVRRYADMVYATARRVTGNAAFAEDVAQDCFLRLAQSSAGLSGSIAAWLHRTSVNRSLEMLRSERARQKREASVALRPEPFTNDAAEVVARVDEALAALPDELRIAVTEHFLCGKSQAQIAEEQDVTQPTISRWIEKGLSQLRQKLNDNRVGASVVLPMLLLDAAKEKAPASLLANMTKIGLSGIGGEVASPLLARVAAAVCIAAGAAGVVLLARDFLGNNASTIRTISTSPAPGRLDPRPARAAGVIETHEEGEIELRGAPPPLPASDLDASVKFYQRLGFKMVAPGGTTLARDEVRINLVRAGPGNPAAVTIQIEARNVAKLAREFALAGIKTSVADSSPGKFVVTDP